MHPSFPSSCRSTCRAAGIPSVLLLPSPQHPVWVPLTSPLLLPILPNCALLYFHLRSIFFSQSSLSQILFPKTTPVFLLLKTILPQIQIKVQKKRCTKVSYTSWCIWDWVHSNSGQSTEIFEDRDMGWELEKLKRKLAADGALRCFLWFCPIFLCLNRAYLKFKTCKSRAQQMCINLLRKRELRDCSLLSRSW